MHSHMYIYNYNEYNDNVLIYIYIYIYIYIIYIYIYQRTPEECFTTLQSGHTLDYSKANNDQAGEGFLINRKWKHHTLRVNKIVEVYTPTTSFSVEASVSNFYNDVDETLGKPNHYTIVMGDFNAQIGKRTNLMETATGKFGLGLRNEPRNYKLLNTMFHKNAGRIWTW